MILLLFLLIVFSVVSYKKSVLFTAATFMFMGNLSSGIEGVKLFYLIAIVQIFLFYFLGANKRNCDSYPLLILIPTLMAGLCYFVSSAIGEISNYAKNVVNIAAWFYYPYIVWHVMSTKKDVKLYGKILVSFYVIVVLYTFVELALGQNVFAIWAESAEIIEGELGGVESGERFGLLRCNSILPYSSALGMNSSLIFLIIVVLKVKLQKDLPFQKILFYLLPICVLLSGTRSQFVVFAICVLGILLSKEYRRTKEIKTFIIVSIVIITLFSSVFFDIIFSILNSDSSSTEGSNLEMRLTQFAITESYWEQSPWFGHGRSFTWEVAIPENPALLGAESIVFTQLIDHGLVGLVCFYVIGVCLAIWCYRFSKPLSILPISFMVGKTMSTVIGVEYNIPIVLCIFAVRALMLSKCDSYEVKYK